MRPTVYCVDTLAMIWRKSSSLDKQMISHHSLIIFFYRTCCEACFDPEANSIARANPEHGEFEQHNGDSTNNRFIINRGHIFKYKTSDDPRIMNLWVCLLALPYSFHFKHRLILIIIAYVLYWVTDCCTEWRTDGLTDSFMNLWHCLWLHVRWPIMCASSLFGSLSLLCYLPLKCLFLTIHMMWF